jgi:cysteine desulfurase
MSEPRLYLDFNATAPLRPAARTAVVSALDCLGNASSIHAEGRAARELIELARHRVAALVGAVGENVVFTSGGTEAANLALTPHYRRQGARLEFARLFVPAIEHACVLSGHRFDAARVVQLAVTSEGVLDLAALDEQLAKTSEPVLLAVQAANNETGVVQPVAQAAARIHARGGIVVCDAVQAVGRIDCDIAVMDADMVILSAHKFGGPKGAGALVFRDDRLQNLAPLVRGGGQEKGRRAGTENVAAIAGFGAAARDLLETGRDDRLASWRDQVEAELLEFEPAAVIFGRGVPRLPNTSAFALPGLRADTLLIALDLAGVAVSSGSACSSGRVRRSHVLDAMGVDPALAAGAIRISFGHSSGDCDALAFSARLRRLVSQIRARKLATAAA